MPTELPADIYAATSSASNAGLDRANDASEPIDMASMSNTDVAEALLSEHPDYRANLAKWTKYADLYEGDDVYKYIYQHPRETDEVFQQRVARASYYNYCAGVVDLFVAYMFASDISRDLSTESKTSKLLEEEFKDIYRNADMQGTSYEAFMHQVATGAQVYGHIGVLVDAQRVGETVISERDRKQEGARPFLNLVSPTQILDWSKDRFGNFNWVKIELPVEDKRASFQQGVAVNERHFLIWDREGWELWAVVQESNDTEGRVNKAILLDSGVNPENIQGEVPLVIFQNCKRMKHDWFGNSTIRDIADINISVMNWGSLADEEIHNRCLNILAMERDNTGDVAANLSHHNVLEYSPGTNAPTYLTPGSTPLELIGTWMDRGRDEIYRHAKLGGSTGLLGMKEATSGIAYAYEFNETNQSLAEKASSMEAGENRVHSLLARWFGEQFTGNVEYPRDFGVDDFLLELEILIKGRTALTSESAIKEMEKRLTSKMFSRKGLDFRKVVEKEIESAEAIPMMAGSFDSVPVGVVQGSPTGTSRLMDPPKPEPTAGGVPSKE